MKWGKLKVTKMEDDFLVLNMEEDDIQILVGGGGMDGKREARLLVKCQVRILISIIFYKDLFPFIINCQEYSFFLQNI